MVTHTMVRMGSDWELQDSDDADSVNDDDDDDLEITRVFSRNPRESRGKHFLDRLQNLSSLNSHSDTRKRPQPEDDSGYRRSEPSDHHDKRQRAASTEEQDRSIVVESDEDDQDMKEEFNDGEATYQKFKNRKKVGRKRASLRAQRAKAGKRAAKDSVVGRISRNEGGSSRAPPRQMRDYGDEVLSDDDLMEHTLPEFLQQRRSRFDERMNALKQAGLRIPPTFENVMFSDDERLEELKEKPDFPGLRPSGQYKDIQLPYSLGLIPAPIAQWLREYQVEGAAFLHELFVYQKGGILGDDMGLGKTVQVIAFLTAAYGKTGDERDSKRMRKIRRTGDDVWYPRTLIICPGTLIQNWKSELQRWGWWAVGVFHGDRKEEALQSAKTGRLEILITTYTTYRMNKDSINMVEWDCVVADECHQIKERKSETTISMNEVNALCRIGLTGTAIQNKYE
jgi:SNF2 family DNA or RNA helicase